MLITTKTKKNNQKLARASKQKTAWFLGITFTLTNIITPLFVAAAPQVFSSPNAGISRIPLGSGVSTPGFGELNEAINVASGNVYVDTGAVARNNILTSNDETANSIGGGQWQLKSRLRLNGFTKNWGNELSTNKITEQNAASSYWSNYHTKPQVVRVNGFATSDGGCGQNTSGILRIDATNPLPSGQYRVVADVRSDLNMNFVMGVTDSAGQTFTATPQWQTFISNPLNLTTTDPQRQSGRIFKITENIPNNPFWEVSNIRILRFDPNVTQESPTVNPPDTGIDPPSNNSDLPGFPVPVSGGAWVTHLFLDQNINSNYWSAYCTKPNIISYSRFLSADNPALAPYGAQNHSGIYHAENLAPGKYRASINARTRNGTLPVTFGLSDYNVGYRTLTTAWQNLTQDFTVPAGSTHGRVFQIFELTANNPSWEIKDISVKQIFEPAPTITLSSGDGSTTTFNKVGTPNSTWFTDKPSWITRYKDATTGNALADTTIYTLAPKGGTQYSSEYVVLRTRAGNNSIAHYYTSDGTRVTFFNDGEFADYTQTLHQQYRGAKYNADPEGELPWTGTGTPKTELTYTSVTPVGSSQPITGLLSKITDEWGRINKYFWSTDGTLNGIQQLVQNDTDLNSWSMAINYSYIVFGNQRLISQIQYLTLDGKGGTISRYTQFEYGTENNTIVVKKVRKQMLGGQNWREIRYSYQAGTNKVSSIKTTNVAGDDLEPEVIYTYNFGGNPVVVNTLQVSVRQGAATDLNRKETVYYYNATTSALVQKNVWTYNPSDGGTTGTWLITKYEYNTTGNAIGSTSKIVQPSGAYETYAYDTRGNNTQIDTFQSSGTRERSRIMMYDFDNRQTNDYMQGESGTRDGATYSYQNANTNGYAKFFSEYSVTHSSGQTFKALSQVNNEVWIVNDLIRRNAQAIDEYGRVTSSTLSSTGLTDQTTTYTYHTGTSLLQPYIFLADNTVDSGTFNTKQYGDLVYLKTESGLNEQRFNYDAFGNIVRHRLGIQQGVSSTGTVENQIVGKYFAFNGFGQQVLEAKVQTATGQVTAADYVYKKINDYYVTGELDSSWENNPKNVTDYRYELTGANAGQVIGIVKGIGTNGGIDASGTRETTLFAYDTFGRVTTKTTDGFATTYLYDPQNRVVRETRPDGGFTAFNFNPLGGVHAKWMYDPSAGAAYQTRVEVYEVDSLGRQITFQPDYYNAPTTVVTTTYDPFDRPIKIKDGRLTMNLDDNSRATFLVYDSLGNLTKKLDPVMRSNGSGLGYLDARRPYTEFTYDGFGRKTREKKLLQSSNPVTPASIAMPTTDVNLATTSWNYDTWNRVSWTTDTDGYSTVFAYDSFNNVIEKKQAVCTNTTASTTANPNACMDNFVDSDGVVDGAATTKYAYNAAGQVVWTTDAKGGISRVIIDQKTQKPAQILDARGVITKVIDYEATGLPLREFEPAPNATIGAGGTPSGDTLSGYSLMKKYSYGARAFPTQICTPKEDTINGACTSLGYDYAGRVTSQVLPVSGSITTTYDARGNVKSLIDAEGFATYYSYDAFNRLVIENKPKRANNQIDLDAFSASFTGFENTYVYDVAGNLTRKTERGLTTDYGYNSMGKTQNETRPYKTGATPNYKWYAYRLDGEKVLESSYGYSDTNATGVERFKEVQNHGSTNWVNPNVVNGNLQQYFLTGTGKRATIVSMGGANWEKTHYQSFNGLGLMFQRNHIGNGGIYAKFIRADGTSNSLPHYMQYWKFDGNGNLLKSFKRSVDGNGNVDSSLETDVYNYDYSATNKEVFRSVATKIYAPSTRTPNTPYLVGESGSKGLATNAASNTGGLTLLSVSQVSLNARDLIKDVFVEDKDHKGNVLNRTTKYAYFASGAKSSVEVVGQGTQTFSYDARGRVIRNTDSNGGYVVPNGNAKPTGSAVVTAYATDGTITTTMEGCCTQSIRYPTIGGLTAKVYDPYQCATCAAQPTTTTYKYNQFGEMTNSDAATTIQLDPDNVFGYDNKVFTYDSFGNQLTTQISRNAQHNATSVRTTTGTITRTFNGNNGQLTEKTVITTSYPSNGGLPRSPDVDSLVTYTLDSMNKRTAQATTFYLSTPDIGQLQPYANAAQRFNADDKSEYINANGSRYAGIGYIPQIYQQGFKYDPNNDLTLSSSTKIEELTGSYKVNLDNSSVPVINPTAIETKSYSTTSFNGSVQLLHYLNSAEGKRVNNCFGPPNPNTGESVEYFCVTDVTAKNSVLARDETFSLMDGVQTDSDEWEVMRPFAIQTPATSSNTTLQAPTTPLSVQTGITSASSVTSPSASGQAPSGTASSVTTPTSSAAITSSGTAQPASSSQAQTQGITSPATGTTTTSSQPQSQTVSSPSVGTTTTTISSSQPSNAPTTSSTSTLQAPSQAAPVGVTTTASSVTSPNSAPNVPSTTASSVTSPNASTPSSSTPSASSVTSPSSSNVPSTSASSVTPPVSSGKPKTESGDVKPTDLTADQIKGVKKILQDIYGPAMSLSSTAELSEEEAKKLLGEIEERSRRAAENQLTAMYQRTGMNSSDARLQAQNDMTAVQTYQDARSMTPEQRIEMNTNIAVGIYTGAVKPEEWKETREKIRQTNVKFADCSKANGKDFCKDQFALSRSNFGRPDNDPRRFNALDWSRNQLGANSRELITGASAPAFRRIERSKCNYRLRQYVGGAGFSFGGSIEGGIPGQFEFGGQAQSGLVYAYTPDGKVQFGLAMTSGAFISQQYLPNWRVWQSVPPSTGTVSGALGFSAGLGVSFFAHNSVNGLDALKGASDQGNVNAVVGGSVATANDSAGNQVVLTTLSIGKGIGFSGSFYPVNTTIIPIGEPINVCS